MNNQQSSSINIFLLSDSHMNFIKQPISTSSYSVITRAIRGLIWFHKYNQDLSVHALLSLPEIQSFLSQATAVLFSVGTNFVRVLSAKQIISQVQQIILILINLKKSPSPLYKKVVMIILSRTSSTILIK